ncbi:hypothetical protein FsymDg_0220 [Candidatus Protofrankia datiscae]|uniref:Pyrrolo-quinoline quinone repeat-containing protein n=2 Tax=Frankiaceae TaxID=74712 RepID=F8B2R9_9ACTN|nr:hypothetical protein FsymDg_0220 [Candidatus Protofrankia datiscae]
MTRDGSCVVTFAQSLVLVGGDRKILWEVAGEGVSYEQPTMLPDGGLARIEGGSVVVRSGRSGAVSRLFPVSRVSELTAMPRGDLLFYQVLADHSAELRCTTVQGEPRWSFHLSKRGGTAPFVFGDVILVVEQGFVHGLGHDGVRLWSFDHRAFVLSGCDLPPPDGPPVSGGILGRRPTVVGDTTLFVTMEWYAGSGFFLVDTAGHQIRRFESSVPLGSPLTVLADSDNGVRVAMLGPRIEIRPMEWNWQVIMLDLGGTPLWRHQLHAPPLCLVPGPGGTLLVIASPSRKQWDDYHKWHDLSDQTFVRCLEPDGSARWTWYAPGPISHLPVVSPDGIVYVGSERRLWTLTVASDSR